MIAPAPPLRRSPIRPRRADAAVREARARRALEGTLVAMQRAYATAARELEELDAHLREVRRDLEAAGYLTKRRRA